MNGVALKQAYPNATAKPLGYDPSTALGLDTIQASALSLNSNELDTLSKNGLVISKRLEFPSFAYGYKSIYLEDLPVYVSADSILEAVHRTFDSLLKQTEEVVLVGELTQMLSGMHSRLVSSSLDVDTAKDADLYLTLAESLLKGALVKPTAGASESQVSALYALATAGSGHQTVELFGVSRDEDFSQFTPRGHYTDSAALGRYFRAMMWLGQVDLRLVETRSDGAQAFNRRQFDAAVALRELLGVSEFALWAHIDTTIGAYVG